MRSGLFKVEGAGNDFVLGLGDWATRFEDEPALVRRVCDRRRGIGADGVLAVHAESARRARVVYRNADGSRGDFCANGTRCAARAAVELLGCRRELTLATGWTEIPARVDGVTVRLELPPPAAAPRLPAIELRPPLARVLSLEVGVPHLVVAVTGPVEALELATVAPPLRAHEALGPAGANVDFYEAAGDGAVALRTWERGVEGETLSCGSGMVAVALTVMGERGVRRLALRPASGDVLTVEALGEPPVCATRLTGPARIVAEIQPTDELLSGL